MDKKVIIIGIAVLLISISLCGCNENGSKESTDEGNNGDSNDENEETNDLTDEEIKFVGKWRRTNYLQDGEEVGGQNYTLEFYSDRTYISNIDGNVMNCDSWNATDKGFTLNCLEQIDTWEYQFSNNGKTLTISTIKNFDGEPTSLTMIFDKS